MEAQTRSLPFPSRQRWQPLRSGLVNLYRYDREEFHYEEGRLLLRGNNGTGKSRVLALQLPFLLDGEVNAQRLEPDADPSKRIEWNLLMDRYPERTDRKSTRLNSSHGYISYAVFCLKKKKTKENIITPNTEVKI